MPPLPPMSSEDMQTSWAVRTAGITPLPRYSGPVRRPLAVGRLPGHAGYMADLALRRWLLGALGLAAEPPPRPGVAEVRP